MVLLINSLFSHCDLCLSVVYFSHLKDDAVQNMRRLDWLKFVIVLTLTVFPAFHAFSQPAVIIALVSPSFKVLFPPLCDGPPRGLHLDSQTEEERERARLKLEEQLLVHPAAKAWQQVPGEAGGTWFTQDQHSWSSFWLAERGFLRHQSDWPCDLATACWNREGCSESSTPQWSRCKSHFTNEQWALCTQGGFDLRAKKPFCWTGCWLRRAAVRSIGKDPLSKKVSVRAIIK